MRKIIREEGILSLWGGTVPSLVLAINPAIHFAVYEALKRYATGGKTVRKVITYSSLFEELFIFFVNHLTM